MSHSPSDPSELQAWSTLRAILMAAGMMSGVDIKRKRVLDADRFGFLITVDDRECSVMVPGVVPRLTTCSRFNKRIWVNGHEWFWRGAIEMLRFELLGKE